jgi:serine/threonine protein kinase
MSIGAGTRLGPYELQTLLGAGGMGEVYRARDTRLDRTVAIKVLPADATHDPEQRQRLDREARLIAGLTHPHICTLYDIGHQDGIDYLVMEHLEGETLAARLAKGALPLDQTLKYAIEIADALDKAHRAGIVHRDLKPGNVMLTKSGAKLLDFGLAKTVERGGFLRGPVITDLPTSPASLTAKGMILGTLQYMAPEQLEGEDADARTDIFALGTVIYEMATGKKAFSGESQASLIAAILAATPPAISTLQPLTPTALDHVVKTCLAKDPDERWQSAGDVKRELRWILEGDAQSGQRSGTITVPTKRSLRGVWLGIAVVTIAALGVILWNTLRVPIETNRVIRSVIPLAEPLSQFVSPRGSAVAISPDGRYVVYQDDRDQLHIRSFDQEDWNPVVGAVPASRPFFSPDSQWLGYLFNPWILRKIPVRGGAALTIVGDAGPTPPSWADDGTIVCCALSRVAASGGKPQPIAAPDWRQNQKAFRNPEALPGSHAVIYTDVTYGIRTYSEAPIEVIKLATGQRKVVVDGGILAHYAASGHLVYARDGSLFAVPFDLKRLTVTGAAIEVMRNVRMDDNFGAADFSLSRNGTLVYAQGGVTGNDYELVWVDRHGRAKPLTSVHRAFAFPRLSKDSQRLVVRAEGANPHIWVHDFARGSITPFTTEWDNNTPTWTPDGKRVTFSMRTTTRVIADEPQYKLYWQSVDRSGPPEPITQDPGEEVTPDWSPDGQVVAFVRWQGRAGSDDIWTMRVGDTPRPYRDTQFQEDEPRFSPNGRWLAYTSNETGRSNLNRGRS